MEELEIPLDNVDFDSLTLSSFMLIILIHIDKVRIEKRSNTKLKGNLVGGGGALHKGNKTE